MSTVVTRFAPSPTGFFHAGSYRTALFAYIFARQNKGKFILRIEDTDKERSKKEYEDNILDSLKWLGLDHDEFYRQSDRTEIYGKYLKKLLDDGKAYVSKEDLTKEFSDNSDKKTDAKQMRAEVIRFKNPNKKVSFTDLVRGRIEFDTTELGDFVIAKSMEEPVFHLVNVIDDSEMGMTHVIRGEDHISNTPRQILIYEAIGAKVPFFAHIPLLLAPDRSKLSKRHGALAMTEYREEGYLPEALVNYMAMLGWHPKDDREVMSLEEITHEFSLERVQKGSAIFDIEKLKWFNRQYILKLGDQKFANEITHFVPEWLSADETLLAKLSPIMRDKISVFSEVKKLFAEGGELAFTHKLADYESDKLLWKKSPDKEIALRHLRSVFATIKDFGGDWSIENIKSSIWSYVEVNGKGDVLWPFRYALTAQERSPDPFISAFILGKNETVFRIETAIRKLSS